MSIRTPEELAQIGRLHGAFAYCADEAKFNQQIVLNSRYHGVTASICAILSQEKNMHADLSARYLGVSVHVV
jgi:hypothetical protein